MHLNNYIIYIIIPIHIKKKIMYKCDRNIKGSRFKSSCVPIGCVIIIL